VPDVKRFVRNPTLAHATNHLETSAVSAHETSCEQLPEQLCRAVLSSYTKERHSCFHRRLLQYLQSAGRLYRLYIDRVATKYEKKFHEFSRLFQSHKLIFPLVIATKSKCNNDLHQGSTMILFTQSTAVLHKYLNDELKILCLLRFFPEVARVHRIP